MNSTFYSKENLEWIKNHKSLYDFISKKDINGILFEILDLNKFISECFEMDHKNIFYDKMICGIIKNNAYYRRTIFLFDNRNIKNIHYLCCYRYSDNGYHHNNENDFLSYLQQPLKSIIQNLILLR